MDWYHDTIERGLTHGGELGDVRDVASKSADNAARLAALFQMFESGFSPYPGCFRPSKHHSRLAFVRVSPIPWRVSLPREMGDATKLDGWIVEHCCKSGSSTVGKTTPASMGRFVTVRDLMLLSAS